jgi:hypothetical protein
MLLRVFCCLGLGAALAARTSATGTPAAALLKEQVVLDWEDLTLELLPKKSNRKGDAAGLPMKKLLLDKVGRWYLTHGGQIETFTPPDSQIKPTHTKPKHDESPGLADRVRTKRAIT